MDLSFLPAQYQGLVVVLCEVIAACSVLALAIKPLLGSPKPDDPGWKRFLFGLLSVVDFLAANTSTIRTRTKLANAEKKVARLGGVP